LRKERYKAMAKTVFKRVLKAGLMLSAGAYIFATGATYSVLTGITYAALVFGVSLVCAFVAGMGVRR
jgi:hypothetical protein